MFPAKHGAHELHLSYTHRYPMLPEVLREAGYHTLGISPNSWMSDEFGATYGFERYLKLWQYRPAVPSPPMQTSGVGAWLDGKLQRWYWRHVFPHRNHAQHVNRHLRALVTKELHLQHNATILFLFFGVLQPLAIAYIKLAHPKDPEPYFMVPLFIYAALMPLVIGSSSIAEETNLGTRAYTALRQSRRDEKRKEG